MLINCSIGSSNPIRFLIDSGADVNVIGGKDWEQLKRDVRSGKAILEMIDKSSSNKLHAYGAQESMIIECSFRAKVMTVESVGLPTSAIFHVVLKGGRSLLGRSTASDMGLLQINNMINQCEDEGIFPKMPGVVVKFSVNKDVPPTKSAYYNVPAAYR